MPSDIHDDDYVANILKQDAKDAKKKYELVGIEAFNPKKSKSGAPKPNTNFLRHIIRQTDSHNAALLAREAEESSARLKELNRDRIRAKKNEDIRNRSKADGRLTPVLSDEEPHTRVSKKHTNHSGDEDGRNSSRRRRDRSVDSRTRPYRSRDTERHREKRKRERSVEERSSRHPRRSEHHSEKDHRRESDRHDKSERARRTHHSSRTHRKHRSRSRSSSRSRSRSPRPSRSDKKHKYRDRSRSPRRTSHHRHDKASPSSRKSSGKQRRRSPASGSDSDPLEAIVGPLPPNAHPAVRSRGRGAHKANSMGMDSRFSASYDPSIDVRQDSDAEDKWGDTVESFRDRQRWKQQGADRLKAAGFTDDQVRKWEKGDEKDEEDVTWTKQGQAREWDRGKVVDEDGDVELKAEWGRLK